MSVCRKEKRKSTLDHDTVNVLAYYNTQSETESRDYTMPPDDDEAIQAISSQPYSLSLFFFFLLLVSSATTTQAIPDSLKPDDYQLSHLVPGHQQSSTGRQLAFKDLNELNENNIYDRLVDFVYGNYKNSNSLCMILSGGNMRKTTKNDPFEENCHNSSVLMYKHFTNLGVENIVMISPIQNCSTGDVVIPPSQKLTSKDIIHLFETIKQKHSENPYSAFFIIIIGHGPGNILRMHNVGEDCYISVSEFYISEDCTITVPAIKSLTEHLASCELLAIIKDMCKADAFDLLPRSKASNAVHIQWSSCTHNGKSYTAVPSSTLFAECILSGIKGQCCAIKKLNY